MSKNLNTDHSHGTDSPPDSGAQGDVSTTGHSDHDAQAHGDRDAHDSHGGGHGPDTSDVSTLVPAGFSQLILPAIILLFVAVLVAGPVMNAFAPRPAAPAPVENRGLEGTPAPESAATPLQSESNATSPAVAPTTAPATTAPAPTQPPATPTTASQTLPLAGTQTAVAQAGMEGEVARVPVKLEIESRRFAVEQGSGLLPDWKASQDENTATWIQGTVANHILYVPYTSLNENLFKAAKVGDTVKLTMNTGQVFSFAVTRTDRAVNGPTTEPSQFSVSAAMAQDHAGITLFLTGDPASDRAVVQADFTGSIQ